MQYQDDRKKLLINYHRRLQALQERQALYGLDTPISILTEIEDIETEIERLQVEVIQSESNSELTPTPNSTTISRAKEVNTNEVGSSPWRWIGIGIVALVVLVGVIAFLSDRNNKGENANSNANLAAVTAVTIEQTKVIIEPTEVPTKRSSLTPTFTSVPPTNTPTPVKKFIDQASATATTAAPPTDTPTPKPAPTLTSTPTPSPSPVPVPSPTPPSPGQNCRFQPGNTFAVLWPDYGSLLGCPLTQQQTISTIAEEVFQGGHLFWREDTNEVYVIYDRQKNGGELFEGSWYTDPTWNWTAAGEPDPEGIGLSPPSGLVEPKRGFGWLWRTYLGREDGKLGWALDREYGFNNTGQVQMFEEGIIWKGSSAKVYALLNDNRFFAK